ncbi:MAG: DUF4145 domain-containing protein [Planctomycetota bacterium]|nr:DUF4145 domain-containing protein [Planctomycetota bacterium]
MDDRIQRRFDELADNAESIASTRREKTTHVPGSEPFVRGTRGTPDRTFTNTFVDPILVVQWQTSVSSLFSRVFANHDPTFQRFADACKANLNSALSFDIQRSIFRAAKEDFEGGYLFDIQNLVHSDVFIDELEQAKHFLDKGFKVPAAVIAGTVLETTLRRMCDTHSGLTPSDNINAMNNDLYTANVYGKASNKQVGSWGDIRNDAAHGRPDEFDPKQVSQMIDGVRDFVAKHIK